MRWSSAKRARNTFILCRRSAPFIARSSKSAFLTASGSRSLTAPAVCLLFLFKRAGHGPEATAGTRPIPLPAAGNARRSRSEVDKVPRDGSDALSVEYPIELPDGSTKTIWTHGLLVKTPDGLCRWVGVNIDVTEREAVKEELRQQAQALKAADRQKERVSGALGHQLRNPLAPIRNALHILLQPNIHLAVVGQLKGMMEKQINHLTRLVDDLLDVSRISRGKIELRKESAWRCLRRSATQSNRCPR